MYVKASTDCFSTCARSARPQSTWIPQRRNHCTRLAAFGVKVWRIAWMVILHLTMCRMQSWRTTEMTRRTRCYKPYEDADEPTRQVGRVREINMPLCVGSSANGSKRDHRNRCYVSRSIKIIRGPTATSIKVGVAVSERLLLNLAAVVWLHKPFKSLGC